MKKIPKQAYMAKFGKITVNFVNCGEAIPAIVNKLSSWTTDAAQRDNYRQPNFESTSEDKKAATPGPPIVAG
jgi:hypothetical protein